MESGGEPSPVSSPCPSPPAVPPDVTGPQPDTQQGEEASVSVLSEEGTLEGLLSEGTLSDDEGEGEGGHVTAPPLQEQQGAEEEEEGEECVPAWLSAPLPQVQEAVSCVSPRKVEELLMPEQDEGQGLAWSPLEEEERRSTGSAEEDGGRLPPNKTTTLQGVRNLVRKRVALLQVNRPSLLHYLRRPHTAPLHSPNTPSPTHNSSNNHTTVSGGGPILVPDVTTPEILSACSRLQDIGEKDPTEAIGDLCVVLSLLTVHGTSAQVTTQACTVLANILTQCGEGVLEEKDHVAQLLTTALTHFSHRESVCVPVLSCVLCLSPLPCLLPLTAPLTSLLRCPHMSDDTHHLALQALQHVALGEGEMQSLVTVLKEARTDRGRGAAMQALATRLSQHDKAQHAVSCGVVEALVSAITACAPTDTHAITQGVSCVSSLLRGGDSLCPESSYVPLIGPLLASLATGPQALPPPQALQTITLVQRLIASAPSAPLLPLVAERVAQAAPVWTHQAHDTETTKDAEATQVLPGLLYTLHLTLNNTHSASPLPASCVSVLWECLDSLRPLLAHTPDQHMTLRYLGVLESVLGQGGAREGEGSLSLLAETVLPLLYDTHSTRQVWLSCLRVVCLWEPLPNPSKVQEGLVQRLESACSDKDRDTITATAHALTHTIRSGGVKLSPWWGEGVQCCLTSLPPLALQPEQGTGASEALLDLLQAIVDSHNHGDSTPIFKCVFGVVRGGCVCPVMVKGLHLLASLLEEWDTDSADKAACEAGLCMWLSALLRQRPHDTTLAPALQLITCLANKKGQHTRSQLVEVVMGRCVDLAPSITHSHSLLTHNCTALLSVLGCSKGPLPPTLATRLMPPLLQHHINTHEEEGGSVCALMDMMLRDHANIALEDGAVGHLLASIAESQDVQGEAKAWTLLQHLLQAGGEGLGEEEVCQVMEALTKALLHNTHEQVILGPVLRSTANATLTLAEHEDQDDCSLTQCTQRLQEALLVHATAPPPPPPLDDIQEIECPVPSTALHSTPPDAPTEEAEEGAEAEAKAEGQEEAALVKAIQEALLSQGTENQATALAALRESLRANGDATQEAISDKATEAQDLLALLLAAMHKFPEHVGVQSCCLGGLLGLVQDKEHGHSHTTRLAQAQGLQCVSASLRRHSGHPNVLPVGLSMVCTLASAPSVPEVQAAIIASQLSEVLVGCLFPCLSLSSSPRGEGSAVQSWLQAVTSLMASGHHMTTTLVNAGLCEALPQLCPHAAVIKAHRDVMLQLLTTLSHTHTNRLHSAGVWPLMNLLWASLPPHNAQAALCMLELCLRLSQAPPLPDKPKAATDRDEAWAADLLLHTAKLHTKSRDVQLWCLRLACALLGPHASPMLHKRLSVTALLPILLARLKTYKEDVVVAGVCMHVLAAMAQGGPSNRTELVQEECVLLVTEVMRYFTCTSATSTSTAMASIADTLTSCCTAAGWLGLHFSDGDKGPIEGSKAAVSSLPLLLGPTDALVPVSVSVGEAKGKGLNGLLLAVPSAMQGFKRHGQLQCEALLALSRLCVNGEAAEVLGQAGACQSLVTATALHANKPTVVPRALTALECLASLCPQNRTRLLEAGAYVLVRDALSVSQDGDSQHWALAIALPLLLPLHHQGVGSKAADVFSTSGICTMTTQAIRNHWPRLVLPSLHCIALLAHSSPLNRQTLRDQGAFTHVLTLLQETNKAEVQTSCCVALAGLLEDEDVPEGRGYELAHTLIGLSETQPLHTELQASLWAVLARLPLSVLSPPNEPSQEGQKKEPLEGRWLAALEQALTRHRNQCRVVASAATAVAAAAGESSPLSPLSLVTLRRVVGPLVLSCVGKLRQAKGKEEDKQQAAAAAMQALALLAGRCVEGECDAYSGVLGTLAGTALAFPHNETLQHKALHACHVWLLVLHPTPVIVPGKNAPKAPVRPLSEAEEGKVLQAVQAAVKTHPTHTPLLVSSLGIATSVSNATRRGLSGNSQGDTALVDRVLQLGPTLVAAAIAKSQQDLHGPCLELCVSLLSLARHPLQRRREGRGTGTWVLWGMEVARRLAHTHAPQVLRLLVLLCEGGREGDISGVALKLAGMQHWINLAQECADMDASCVVDVMGVVRWLGPLFPQHDYQATGLWNHVVQCMASHPKEVCVQASGCHALWAMLLYGTHTAQPQPSADKEGALGVLLAAIHLLPHDKQSQACAYLSVSWLRASPSSAPPSSALPSLTSTEGRLVSAAKGVGARAVVEGRVSVVIKGMAAFPHDPAFQAEGCRAIAALCGLDDATMSTSASTSTSTSTSFSTATTYRGLLGNGGGCELLADAIKQHPHDNHMQLLAWEAVAALCSTPNLHSKTTNSPLEEQDRHQAAGNTQRLIQAGMLCVLPSLLQHYQCRSQGVVAALQWGLLSLCSVEGGVRWLVKQVEQHKTQPKLTRGFMQVLLRVVSTEGGKAKAVQAHVCTALLKCTPHPTDDKLQLVVLRVMECLLSTPDHHTATSLKACGVAAFLAPLLSVSPSPSPLHSAIHTLATKVSRLLAQSDVSGLLKPCPDSINKPTPDTADLSNKAQPHVSTTVAVGALM